ncbi:MAG: phage vB BmeM-Goe8 [Bacteroidota bacterium]|jgi:hypothetical protein
MNIEDYEESEGCIILTGYDDCIIGITEEFGGTRRLLYDKSKIIQKLMNDGMDDFEALEFFDYNILGLYAGEQNPIFLDIPFEGSN